MREYQEGAPERRRRAIEAALVRLFRQRPEYRARRVGQIVCKLAMGDYLPDEFPRGVDPGGLPRDSEVAHILRENGVEVAA